MLLAKCLMPLLFFFSIIVGAVSQQPRDLIRMYLEEVVNNRKLDLLPQIFTDLMRFTNGKIVEFWTQVDWHNLFRQLKKE